MLTGGTCDRTSKFGIGIPANDLSARQTDGVRGGRGIVRPTATREIDGCGLVGPDDDRDSDIAIAIGPGKDLILAWRERDTFRTAYGSFRVIVNALQELSISRTDFVIRINHAIGGAAETGVAARSGIHNEGPLKPLDGRGRRRADGSKYYMPVRCAACEQHGGDGGD